MYHFHTNVFAWHEQIVVGGTIELRGIALQSFVDEGGGPALFTAPLPITFDEIQRRLIGILRMDIEPDGNFLVAGDDDGRWQVDGQLFEYNDQMHRVEMHGACSEELFDDILGCFDWPEARLVFQLVHEGVALDEANFRRWAER